MNKVFPQKSYLLKLKNKILNQTSIIRKRLDNININMIRKLAKLKVDDMKLSVNDRELTPNEAVKRAENIYNELKKESKSFNYNGYLRKFIVEAKGKTDNDLKEIYDKHSKMLDERFDKNKKLLMDLYEIMKVFKNELSKNNNERK